MSVSLVTAVGYMSKWQYRMIMLIYYLQNYKNYQYYQLRWLSLLLQADISESCSDTQFRISNMKRWEFSGSFRCARHKHRLRTRPLRIVFGYSLRWLSLAVLNTQLVVGTNKVAASYISSRMANHKSFGDKLTDSIPYQSTADMHRFIQS